MRNPRNVVSHATAHIRWYVLMYLYGLIATCLELFIEQTLHPYLPGNMPFTVVSVVVLRPLVFVVVARGVVRLKKQVFA